MLHEPEFESNSDTSSEETAPAKKSTAGRILRGVFYSGVAAMLAVAVGVQASPKFAAAVGRSVPEPVAAALSSVTGTEMTAMQEGSSCCSSMRSAELASAGEEGCCSSMSRASLMASTAGPSCCSESGDSSLASTEAGCTGVCPSSMTDGTLADSSEVADEEAVSLPALEETFAVETVTEELVDETI